MVSSRWLFFQHTHISSRKDLILQTQDFCAGICDGLRCEVCLALSTHPELSVPWDVCQAEVLEFWDRANRRSMRLAAEKIRGSEVGLILLMCIKRNKLIIPLFKKDVLNTEKLVLHSCKMHLNHPAEALIYIHVNVF